MPSLTDLSPLVPRLPQFAQAKNRIVSQMSVIRQQLSMIEAYDMDGWKGARYAVSAISRSRRSVVRRDRTPENASSDEAFDFLFLFFFSPPRSPFNADETETHPVRSTPNRSREKLRPTAEIAKARAKIFHAKLRVRELFKALDFPKPHANAAKIVKKPAVDSDDDLLPAAAAEYDSDSGIDAEDIFDAPAARATRTTTTTSCCATGSARARTTCPAWTRR